jgi:preprotein translocase subunit SecB
MAAPPPGLISQYVKDLSFENPNAPGIYQAQAAPGIDVQFNISASQVGEEVHELVLKIEVRAESEGKTAFIVDLSYAGLFGFRNVPVDQIQPFMLGEAPACSSPSRAACWPMRSATAASRR